MVEAVTKAYAAEPVSKHKETEPVWEPNLFRIKPQLVVSDEFIDNFFTPYSLLTPEEELYLEAYQILEETQFAEEIRAQKKRFPLMWGSVTARSILAVLSAMRSFLKAATLKRQLAVTSLDAQQGMVKALTKAIKKIAYHEKWNYNYDAIKSFISGTSSVANVAYTAFATSSIKTEQTRLEDLKSNWEVYQGALEQAGEGDLVIGRDALNNGENRDAIEQMITDIRLGRQKVDDLLPVPAGPEDRFQDFNRLPREQQDAIRMMTRAELTEARQSVIDNVRNLDERLNTKSNQISSAQNSGRLFTDMIRDFSTGVVGFLQGSNAVEKGDAQALQSEIELAKQMLQQLIQEVVQTAQQMAEQVRNQQDLLKQIEQMNTYKG